MKSSDFLYKVCYQTRLNPLTQSFLKAYQSLAPLEKPIFIIGLNRSGTTITTKLVNQSQEIIDWSEANEVWDPIGYPFENNKVVRPFWPIDAQGYTDSVINSVPRSYLEAVPGLFSVYVRAKKGNRKSVRFMNTCPMNATRVKLLNQLFPDAYFLSLVRDPRAVIRSMLNKIVPKLNAHPTSEVEVSSSGKKETFNISGTRYSYLEMIEAMAKNYNYVVGKQLEDLNTLPEEKVFYTCYEHLSNEVHKILKQVDQKFNLDSNLRDWDKIPEKLESRNYKFKTEFSERELEAIASACSPMMKKLGYES